MPAKAISNLLSIFEPNRSSFTLFACVTVYMYNFGRDKNTLQWCAKVFKHYRINTRYLSNFGFRNYSKDSKTFKTNINLHNKPPERQILKADDSIVRFSCKKWETTPLAHKVISIFDIKSFEKDELEKIYDRSRSSLSQALNRSDVFDLVASSKIYKISQKQSSEFLDELFKSKNELTRDEFVSQVNIIGDKVDGTVNNLAFIFLATGLSVGVVIPLMPQIAELLSLSTTQYGIIISSFAFSKKMGNIPAARLVEKFGKKKLITFGLFTIGLANLQLATFLSYNWILSSRVIIGLGVSALTTASTLVLSGISTTKNRARTIAPPMAAFSVGTAIGPAVGGFLLNQVGLYQTFALVGVYFLGVSCLSQVTIKEPFLPELDKQKETSQQESGSESWKRLLKDPNIFNIALLHAGYWFVLSGCQMTVMPLLLSGPPFDCSATTLGYIYTSMSTISVIGTQVSGRLLDKFGKINLILPAAFTVGTAMVFASQTNTLTTFLPFLYLWVASSTLLSSGPTAFVSDSVSAKDRNRALALLRTAGDIGMLTGSISTGYLADYMGHASVMGSNGISLMTLASLVAFRFLARQRSGY